MQQFMQEKVNNPDLAGPLKSQILLIANNKAPFYVIVLSILSQVVNINIYAAFNTALSE